MSVPTTYCGTIYNFTPRPYNVVNQDRNGQSVGVPAATAGMPGIGTFPSTQIFPWCSNATEIRASGWVFRSGSTTPGQGGGAFYMFQEPNRNHIAWSAWAGGSPAYPGTDANASQQYIVNVRIVSAFNPSTPTGDIPIADRVQA
jgi:hypothetical protein